MNDIRRKTGGAADMAQTLRRAISQGVYGRGGFLPPLRRLADESGVAYLTASRALKILARDGLVAAEPRRGYRVLRAGARSSGARALFGFVSGSHPDNPELWNETHKALLAGFQCATSASGLGIVAMSHFQGAPADAVRAIQEAGLAGVALDSDNPALIRALRAAKIPAVLVDAYTYDVEVDGVVQDNFRGGFLAGEHLAKLGHREVAWFGLASDSIHSRERLGGALIGLRSSGGGLAPAFERRVTEYASGIPTDEARREARVFLAAPGRPRAILALWQSTASALLGAAGELQLRAGEDFELVTWGVEENRPDVYASRFGHGRIPPMVCWSARRMAELAVARLMARPADGNPIPVRISVPMQLHVQALQG